MLFYKVVRKDGNLYKSAFVGSSNDNYSGFRAPEYELTYVPNEITFPHPDTRGIFVFDRLNLAEFFASDCLVFQKLEVWECEVTNPQIMEFVSPVEKYALKIFWNIYKTKNFNHYQFRPAPSGSYIVDSCKITKRVS